MIDFFDGIMHARANDAQLNHVNIIGDECGWSMDAPEVMPAGSTHRTEPAPDAWYATQPFAASARAWRD